MKPEEGGPRRGRAVARIALGQAQIVAAVVSFCLLIGTGVSQWTVWAVAVTALLFVVSKLLFRQG